MRSLKMLSRFKKISIFLLLIAILSVIAVPVLSSAVYAEESTGTEVVAVTDGETATNENADNNAKSSKAISAAIAVGIAAALGALAMGIAIAKSNEAIARQPEAASQIRSGLMLGLVFIETAIIYALIVAILIIFVL